MPTVENKLLARDLKRLPTGRHGDGGGLYLTVGKTGARSWSAIISVRNRQKEISFGRAGDGPGEVTLAQARRLRDEAKAAAREGRDPVAERRAAKAPPPEIVAADAPTFAEVADAYIAKQRLSWRGDKTEAGVKRVLELYAAPLRPLPIRDIITDDVLAVLNKDRLWDEKQATAVRLASNLDQVFAYAFARKLVATNPAAWSVIKQLVTPYGRSKKHHRALPWRDMAKFMARLRERSGSAARALEFAILTASRASMVLELTWKEIDFRRKVWVIPASRMKEDEPHHVPLTPAMIAVLKQQLLVVSGGSDDLVFPGQNEGARLWTDSLSRVLARMELGKVATPHGFRSSFRDWAGNGSRPWSPSGFAFPREQAEEALAHAVGDATERAYRREQACEERRPLMEAWCAYCAGETPPGAAAALAEGSVAQTREAA